jgi:hypothetical protein
MNMQVGWLILLTGCRLACPAGEATAWVERLGAAAFAEREAASEALWQMGAAALEAVEEATRHPDPEVRLRSQKLFPMLKMGIRPEWPEALRERGLKSEEMTENELQAFMKELLDQRGVEAYPYLIVQTRGPAEKEALDLLMSQLNEPAGVERILALLTEPATEGQSTLLMEAYLVSDLPDAIQRALKLPHLTETTKKKLINKSVEQLLGFLREKAYNSLRDQASLYASLAPGTARLLYLQAAGEAFLGKPEVNVRNPSILKTRFRIIMPACCYKKWGNMHWRVWNGPGSWKYLQKMTCTTSMPIYIWVRYTKNSAILKRPPLPWNMRCDYTFRQRKTDKAWGWSDRMKQD